MSARCLPFDDDGVAEAARLIRAGEPVALPSETVYGLAADATDARAVAAIYAAKGRPSFNPLIVHVADRAMAETIADFSAEARRLADAFWPGPLTLVLPRRSDGPVCDLVAAGLSTIAIRMPSHPAMLAVIRASGRPLAAPSANRSGAISPTRAQHVLVSLGDRIALVLDAGPTVAGIESTIVAPGASGIRILRPGPVTAAQLEALSGLTVVGAVTGTEAGAGGGIESPGQLASHYCPDKPVRLAAERAEADEYLIGFGAMAADFNLSPAGDLVEAAAHLFAALHEADASPARAIAVAAIPHEGIGIAINDRLARAAVR
ncbi:threonylcarbamoyl-AMP synthase [Sphingobium sufflavum]|uniref:L-threonylcarbamoyladenylate synthase n=1 Tax=Sphingobium sufflavum TaxID=1129547 RepID=UPI001F462F97|nr:L-threonylcarbamoyladenylate synthase [Sphingobium sufflavum]MCE7796099.1 threonylcarbamoyl-AMP synthase [Sphingobium sufflavum]